MPCFVHQFLLSHSNPFSSICRAKNNVVIFDRDPKKCAAFFHLLKSLRMARVVESSLLVDGADAKKYGLSRLTVSSEAEWFKRAKNLQANKIFDMAAKAFVQAKEPTRAAVASAYAYMQVDEEEVDGGRRDWQEEKKDRLSLACLLLAAAQRSNECLAPIDRSLVRKWILSAANAMSQVPGDSFKRFAIDIFMSMKEIRKALRVAKQLKNPDRSLEAKLSLSLYQLNKDKSRLATPSMVSAFGIDEEARLAEEKALKDRLMLLQTAAKAYYGLKVSHIIMPHTLVLVPSLTDPISSTCLRHRSM